MGQSQSLQPPFSHTMQRWLIVLLALMLLLPSMPAAASVLTTARDDETPSAILDPSLTPNPFPTRTIQPLLIGRYPSRLSNIDVKSSNAVELTAAVAATTTVTEDNRVDTTPADDAYQAWNSRAAVTRADAYPVRIQIPALKIDTIVEQLGERADGSMATPTNPSNVAWYSYGAIPGENGNVVMAGHLDRADGSPAIFWDLAKLKTGDEIIVYDSTETAYRYTVTKQQSYSFDKAPLDKIFGFDLVSQLNLITCRGNWDRNRQTYSQRLVVYTKLVEIVPGSKP